MTKRLKKNISFSPSEKDIYDFLGQVPNASALIKELVLGYMLEIGYYKSLDERIKKNRVYNYTQRINYDIQTQKNETETSVATVPQQTETESDKKTSVATVPQQTETNITTEKTEKVEKVKEKSNNNLNKELALKLKI